MPNYRAVVDHVGYWRGTVHRWSTSYSFTGSGTAPNSAACDTLLAADSAICYAGTNVSGGIPEVRFYNTATGGVPVVAKTYFDYAVPADWIKYTSTGWATHTNAPESALETALLIEWPAGLSTTGKPVTFRKWYHAVKVSINQGGDSGQDMLTADLTALTGAAASLTGCLVSTYGLTIGNAGRLVTGAAVVSPYYSNHQMPKGRRRTSLSKDGTKYKVKSTPSIIPDEPIDAD